MTNLRERLMRVLQPTEDQKVLLLALVDAIELLEDSLRSRTFTAPEDSEVKEMGMRIGFGALMDAAQKGWREYLEPMGCAGGELTVGRCRTIVEQALAALDAKLKEMEPANE